ncbi:SMP-30/gluconolactonase/LRE family protein [Rhizomonospora bruguierae]|uniref:SMP-30/gluconolactonase/LRE family protein n=1 Tax=Rhizomonospora bruguierae TaxID=1581705 RepID=UPI001BCC4669|nr:SMP-30/gluconolactonase/LRE family protein [Micromonospora sp. NBRC 107566]
MLRVFDERRCELGEGPHRDERTGRFWWVDILGSRALWRADDDSVGEFALPGHVGALVPRAAAGHVACLPEGPATVDENGAVTPLASYPSGPPEGPAMRSNDAKADPVGRLWLGTMAYDETPGAAALYRLERGGALTTTLTGLTISNGLGWSPDGRTMYHIDTPTGRVDAYPFDMATGALGERRTFATIDRGSPDGMCVDAEGGVWVALWGGGAVLRFTPDGTLDATIEVPTPQVTACAFGGETLVITTAAVGRPDDPAAGLTYAIEPGYAGPPVDRFAG